MSTTSKIRILLCTDGIFPFTVGGIQRHSRLLSESLSRTGEVDLSVIHPHENENVFDPGLAIKEIVLPRPKSTGLYLADCYNYSKRVHKTIMSHPDHLVYAQGFAAWYGMKDFQGRLILNPHGLEPFQGTDFQDVVRGLPFRIILRHQFRNSSKVVSLGGKLTGIISKTIERERIAVLPNAVNVPEKITRNYDKEVLEFLFVGRFAFNKGIDILCKVIGEINDTPDAARSKFHIVGDGPLFERFKDKFQFSNLEFHGFAGDSKLDELYESCDFFVLPTLFEGMPTVVLEAMARAMPVIVTDVGATNEMVSDKNGIIIEKGNAGSLKNAILKLIRMPVPELMKLSDASYEIVNSKFTWRVVADAHLTEFRKMAGHDNT